MFEINTRIKLEETKHFLDALIRASDDPKLFSFNLCAFLNAWRSVLDIMLYDLAEHFSLGFSREGVINDRDFKAVAKTLKQSSSQACA